MLYPSCWPRSSGLRARRPLHNARAIRADLHAHGSEVWSRFSAGRSDQLWYYRSLAEAFQRLRPGAMAEELARTVEVTIPPTVSRRPATTGSAAPGSHTHHEGVRHAARARHRCRITR